MGRRRGRLLVLTPRLPYPVVGGDRLRIYQVARALSAQLDLTLVSLCESRAELTLPTPDDGVFSQVHRVLRPPWRSWLSTALAVPSRTPLQVAYYRDRQFHEVAARLAPEHDGVLAHLIRTAPVALRLPGPRFLEMTDAISLNYERVRRTGGHRDPRVLLYAIELARLRSLERSLPARFDASFLVSDVDRRYLFPDDAATAGRVEVCPNGVDVSALPYRTPQPGDDRVLVFVGNLCSLQNFDAAQHAAADILPLVRARHPGARLRIVGRIPEDKARVLRGFPGVEVTGEVDSVADATSGGAVGVAPLRLAAGIQNKVLEYLALGLPTVTTTVALEGLHARPGTDLLVADTARDFADAVGDLLDDHPRRVSLARAGRHYVERNHDWHSTLAPLVQRVVETITPGPS